MLRRLGQFKDLAICPVSNNSNQKLCVCLLLALFHVIWLACALSLDRKQSQQCSPFVPSLHKHNLRGRNTTGITSVSNSTSAILCILLHKQCNETYAGQGGHPKTGSCEDLASQLLLWNHMVESVEYGRIMYNRYKQMQEL